MDREKVIKGWECHMEADTLKCADCPYREGWRTCNYADTLYKDVYAMLKEQEEKPLRCKTCTMRDKTGFCHRWNIEVKDDNYCSFGAWKGCYI